MWSLCAIISGTLAAQDSSGGDPAIKTNRWETFYTLKGGAGYNDNVLRTKDRKINSPFVSAAAEVFSIRVPDEKLSAYGFLSLEHIQYLEGEEVENEQTVLGVFQHEHAMKERLSLGGEYRYIYQDQVFDNSDEDLIRGTIQAKGNSLETVPFAKLDLPRDAWLRPAFHVERQFFDAPLDDYWQLGPELEIGKTFENRSKLEFNYEFAHRDYDSRSRVDADGRVMGGSSLDIQRHEFELEYRFYLDESRNWQSISQLHYRRNIDTDEGYFDYHRYQASQSIRYRKDPWEAYARVSLRRYDYDKQPVGAPGTSARERDEFMLRLRASRNLTQRLKFTVEYEYERSMSNLRSDDYRLNQVAGYLVWDY